MILIYGHVFIVTKLCCNLLNHFVAHKAPHVVHLLSLEYFVRKIRGYSDDNFRGGGGGGRYTMSGFSLSQLPEYMGQSDILLTMRQYRNIKIPMTTDQLSYVAIKYKLMMIYLRNLEISYMLLLKLYTQIS